MEAAVVEQVLGLLFIAFVVGLLVRQLAIPYTVALLVVGIGLGFTGIFSDLNLTSDTILLVFLPALLFQAALALDLKELRAAVLPIALLAVVGVGLSIVIIAAPFAWGIGTPAIVAVVLAAILSATDPVAVLATFKRLRVPARLEMVIEGESLFNDGTALVAFQIALATVPGGGANVGAGILQFVLVVAGGLLLGAAAGFIFSHLLALTSDHLFEMGFSTVLAYGTYLAASLAHVSPVIAVVTAGIVLGNYGHEVGMSERARVVVKDIWEFLAFIANSVLFLLIGQQVHRIDYGAYVLPSVLAIALVLVSRAVIVYGLAPVVSKLERHVPVSWRHVTFWGGLRGALAVAMALSLPESFPERNMLISATFSVVLFTILVQGLSIETLVRRLKIREADLPRASSE
jgi:monovalent cation:H+ antiporter, CPA1 family